MLIMFCNWFKYRIVIVYVRSGYNYSPFQTNMKLHKAHRFRAVRAIWLLFINKAGIISCSCASMGRLYYSILLPLLRTVRVPVTVIVWLMMPCWLHWPDHDLGLPIGVPSLMPYACQPAEIANCCLPWANDPVWTLKLHASCVQWITRSTCYLHLLQWG